MTTIADRTPVTKEGRLPVTVAELVAVVRDQQCAPVPRAPQPVVPTMAVRVEVLGAHGGAGASTVALALAEELVHEDSSANGAAGPPVRLVDRALPGVSALVAAAEQEIASEYAGWRASRRGPVVIYTSDPRDTWPSSDRRAPIAGAGHIIVDVGREWSRERSARSDGMTQTVLVCRATVPGVRRAERVLAELGHDVLLAAVGSRRWSGEVVSTFGPRTHALVEDGRCVLFPSDRLLERCGPDDSSLPKRVTAAATRLVDLLRLPAMEGAHA